MVLAFAIFIVSSSATQDMSKLETRFVQAENFWFLGLSSRLRVRAPAGVPPAFLGRTGPGGPFAELFSARGGTFCPFFPCFSGRKKNNPGNAKKPGNHTGTQAFSWSWKRDLNTRPADYESAALPTELFQHIPISVTFYPLRLQPEAQCVPARLFTLSNNQRPADYESAALQLSYSSIFLFPLLSTLKAATGGPMCSCPVVHP